MFTAYPTYNPYRVLYDRTDDGLPLLRGEDVYALQCALNKIVRADLVLDGILGPATGAAIWNVQAALGVAHDGRAGSATQRAIALHLVILAGVQKGSALFRLAKGAIQQESLYILGNYSPIRPTGTFDAGVVQRNSQFHSLRDAFNPVDSINLWVLTTQDAHSRYANKDLFRDTNYAYPDWKRRWKLAAGAWNAPYFANFYAGVLPSVTPGAAAEVAFLNYVESVGVYL